MKTYRILLILGLIVVGGTLLRLGFNRQDSSTNGEVRLAAPSPQADLSNFSRASAPIEFKFPLDHGAHPDFQTEWWYYTGNLTTEDGQRLFHPL